MEIWNQTPTLKCGDYIALYYCLGNELEAYRKELKYNVAIKELNQEAGHESLNLQLQFFPLESKKLNSIALQVSEHINTYEVNKDFKQKEEEPIFIESKQNNNRMAYFNTLHLETQAEEVLFWGKIYGLKNDYYICLTVNYTGFYQFPEIKYYFAQNIDFNFKELPPLCLDHRLDSQNINTYFEGEPALILKQYEEENPDQDAGNADPGQSGGADPGQQDPRDANFEDYDSDDGKKVEKKVIKNYTEVIRLSWVVRNIDIQCSLVPEGSIQLTNLHELKRNKSFKGLKKEELEDFTKYMFFRNVITPFKREFIEKDDAIFYYNFLDNISQDEIKGSWTVSLDSTKSIVYS